MWMIKALKYLTALINNAEDTVITFVSTIVPWLVPVVPAYLTYNHVHNPLELDFPVWVSFCVGVVVEALGLSSMYTTFQFANHNRRYKDKKNHSPVWIAVITYVFYLATILTVNVVLDVQNQLSVGHIWAIALLSLLSVPAGVLISVRAQHSELVQNIRGNHGSGTRKPEPHVGSHGSSSRTVRTRTKEGSTSEPASRFLPQIYKIFEKTWTEERRVPYSTEVALRLNLNPKRAKGFISTKRSEWMSENNIKEKA